MNASAALPPERRLSLAAVAGVGAIFLQTAAVLLWAGAASERITQVETQLQNMTGLSERTARLEAQMTYIRNSLVRIETKLDRAGDAPGPLRGGRP